MKRSQALVFQAFLGERDSPMSLKLLQDNQLLDLLKHADDDIAALARAEPCRYCGARLHQANFMRKPRGLPSLPQNVELVRHSFCCGHEGCRKRHTPPSVRFLGRGVYLSVVVILVCAVCERGTAPRMKVLREHVGNVDRRTVERWRRWWRETFVSTPCWKQLRGRLSVQLEASRLLGGLLDCFGRSVEGLINLLKELGPLTGGGAQTAVGDGLRGI